MHAKHINFDEKVLVEVDKYTHVPGEFNQRYLNQRYLTPLITAYGLYKWSSQISGIQLIDWVVIIISSIFSLILIISEARNKKPYWILQSIATISFAFAFIAIGMKMEIGWFALFIGHINNTYLYYKKEAYIISLMQIVSIIIVIVKLIG
jgi:hypothetical protein